MVTAVGTEQQGCASVNSDMTTDPAQIRARITELLGEHSEVRESGLDAVATSLEQAHELLVHALESVEKA